MREGGHDKPGFVMSPSDAAAPQEDTTSARLWRPPWTTQVDSDRALMRGSMKLRGYLFGSGAYSVVA